MIEISDIKKPQRKKYRLLTLKNDGTKPDILESDLMDEILKWIRENVRGNTWNISIYIKEAMKHEILKKTNKEPAI